MAVDLKALPPEEAIAYFKAKGFALDPSFDWRDIWQAEHAAQFTVAKSAGFDILADIHGAVLAALQNGTTFTEFKRNLIPTLQDKGWWGRGTALDPTTGESPISQLGSPRRLKTIFDVNLRMTYAAGKWAQAERTKGTHPFVEYSAIMDDRTRPEHKAWNGTVVHMDDPWLDTHTPPCGWNCRCTLRQLSHADLEDEGLAVSKPAPPETVTYTNARTGEVTEVPKGIDPGFGYNPGRAAVDLHAARVAASKWVAAPPPLAAAAQAESVKFMLGALTKDFGQWVTGLDAQIGAAERAATLGQSIPRIKTIGDQRVVWALSEDELTFLAGRGIVPQSGAITMLDRTVVHFLRTAKARRGASLSLADLQRLPEILATPARVLWDELDPALLYVFAPQPAAGADVGKMVVRIDLREKAARQSVVTNSVRSGGLVRPSDLDERMPSGGRRYVDIPRGRKP